MLTGYVPTALDLSQGVVARGRRGTSSATTTTELGVLRVDGITVRAGRMYEIVTPPLAATSSVSGDNAGMRLRYSTAGVATATSTTLTTEVGYTGSFASAAVPVVAKYIPPVDQTLSVILTVLRIAGTGNCSVVANAGNPDIELWIKDVGPDPGDTGVIL